MFIHHLDNSHKETGFSRHLSSCRHTGVTSKYLFGTDPKSESYRHVTSATIELPMIPVEFLGWRAPWYLRAERGA